MSVFFRDSKSLQVFPLLSSSLSYWQTLTPTMILDFLKSHFTFVNFCLMFWNCYLSTYTFVVAIFFSCIYSFIIRKCSFLSVVVILLSFFYYSPISFPMFNVFMFFSYPFILNLFVSMVFKVCLLKTEYILSLGFLHILIISVFLLECLVLLELGLPFHSLFSDYLTCFILIF